MKTLFAVKSCRSHRQEGYHDEIMDTWGKDVPNGDIRFFTGDADRFLPKKSNEVCLGVPDDYMGLPLKTKGIIGWSLWNGYDFTFLCDTDSFIVPNNLLRCGFEAFDYSGRFGAMPEIGTTFHYRDAHGDYLNCHPWASGGVGYFLSRKAGELVAREWPKVWAEDLWVGQVLGPYIQAGTVTASDLPIECVSAWHFPRRQYNNESYSLKHDWMVKMYVDHH
jgi:hypothetical protein